jgi:hypothetical protein
VAFRSTTRAAGSTPPPALESSTTRGARFFAWLKRAWVPVVLVAVALGMTVTVTLNHSHQLSAYDEWVYYDYATKIPTQGIVHQGELIGEPALEVMSCFGDPYGPRGEPCTGPNGHYTESGLYPNGGKTTADLYTPIYFDFTWAAGKAIQLVTGLDFLVAARLTGFFWLAGGLITFYAVGRLLRIPKLVLLGLGLIAMGTLPSVFAFTYITTDAPSFLAGSIVLYLGIRFVRGTVSGWWLIPVAALVVLIKITNIFAVGLVALYMLIYAIMKWKHRSSIGEGAPSPPRIVLVTVLYVVVSVAAEIGWLLIRAAISVGPGPNQGVSAPMSIRGVAAQFTTFLGLNGTRTVDGLLMFPYGILVIAGVFGFLLNAKGSGSTRALSIATATSMTFFPPLLLVAMGVALGSSFPVSTRYAAPLMPAILIAISYILKNKMAVYLLVGYGATLVLAVTTRSFFHPPALIL